MSKKIFAGVEGYELNEDGSITLQFLGGGGFNDYTIAASNLPRAHATAPTLANFRGNIDLPAFGGGGGATEELFGSIHVQHDYMPGTKLFPHIHWSHIIASPSGDVKWQFEYTVMSGFSSGVFAAPTIVSVVEAAGTQYAHQIAAIADADAIPSTNLEADSLVLFRIFRDSADGSDTFANDAFLLAIDVHYQSQLVLTNEKTRPFTKYLKL